MRNFIFLVSVLTGVSMLFFSGASARNKSQAIKDFQSQYKQEAGRKQLSLSYVGKPRNFTQTEGIVKVPFTAYQVKLVDLFESCGLQVEYTWEVWYRRNKTFTQIAILDHKFLNAPAAPEPLPEAKVLELVGNAWEKGSGHYTTKIGSIAVTKQVPGWNFCLPKYELEFTVNLTSGKSHETMHDAWECKAAAVITKKGEDLEVNTNDCFDPKTGKKTQCFYANHCKNLGKKSAISVLSWGDLAKKVLEKGLCESASGSTRSVCKVAALKLLSEGNPTADNKKKTFKLEYQLTFTESNSGRKAPSDPWRVTSRYQCFALAEVEWNDSYEDNWHVSDTKYCPNATGACDREPSRDLFRVCRCMEPASHCEGLKSND